MTTYTLTQAQYEALYKTRSISEVYEIVTSLKPNSQKPVGFVHPIEWKDKQSEQVAKITRLEQSEHRYTNALYTHPAPISKEDMAKVLGALVAVDIALPVMFLGSEAAMSNAVEKYAKRQEAITIMQSAIEGMK